MCVLGGLSSSLQIQYSFIDGRIVSLPRLVYRMDKDKREREEEGGWHYGIYLYNPITTTIANESPTLNFGAISD